MPKRKAKEVVIAFGAGDTAKTVKTKINDMLVIMEKGSMMVKGCVLMVTAAPIPRSVAVPAPVRRPRALRGSRQVASAPGPGEAVTDPGVPG